MITGNLYTNTIISFYYSSYSFNEKSSSLKNWTQETALLATINDSKNTLNIFKSLKLIDNNLSCKKAHQIIFY